VQRGMHLRDSFSLLSQLEVKLLCSAVFALAWILLQEVI